jgi:COP9 signalosome complex subunit 2
MISKQRYMLKMVSKVAREDLAEAVNAVLDSVANNLAEFPDYQSQMYTMTLDVLRTNNERLWFTICLRLAKIHMDLKQYDKLDTLITELKESCRLANG